MLIQDTAQRSAEDHREATKLAVDASKTLIQIAIAVLVMTAGFYRFFLSEGDSLGLSLLVLCGVLTTSSMVVGFYAIGEAYRRGDGRIGSSAAWGTKPIARKLEGQAVCGLIALFLFLGAILFSMDRADEEARWVVEFVARDSEDAGGKRLVLLEEWKTVEAMNVERMPLLAGEEDTETKATIGRERAGDGAATER